MTLRVGTRGSDLALVQAAGIARWLSSRGFAARLVAIETEGDRDASRPLDEFPERGVFVRELERALIDGRVDVAVHSLKDLPAAESPDLVIAAVPRRESAADVLLAARDAADATAPGLPLVRGARVGTSSSRRRAQLLAARDDLRIAPLRGNVPTRVRRLVERRHDAIVLAAAGLARLARDADRGAALREDLAGVVEAPLDPRLFVPAPGQGALAVQVSRARDDLRRALAKLDDPAARRATQAERRVLAAAESGCSDPLGALCRDAATRGEGAVELLAFLDRDGRRLHAGVVAEDEEGAVRGVLRRLGLRESEA